MIFNGHLLMCPPTLNTSHHVIVHNTPHCVYMRQMIGLLAVRRSQKGFEDLQYTFLF